MWEQNRGTHKNSNISDQTQHPHDESSVEPWTSSKKDGTDTSLYDSGRTDSGFLSEANLHPDSIVSEEIKPSSPKASKSDIDDNLKSYSRLDSGVDVGLSDELSQLSIDKGQDVDIMLSKSDIHPKQEETVRDSEPSNQPVDSVNTPRIYWEYYFKQDDDGDTHLHNAIIQGCVEGVYNLISLVPKATVLDIRNDMRQTPLHLAVITGHSCIVRRLVCAGADTRTVDHDGNTPLHIAVSAGDLTSVKALTEPVTSQEVMAAQLRYSAPQIKPLLDMYNYEGLTCVHIAIMGSHISILRHLIRFGANINARECKRGMTCLHMVCETGNDQLALILLREMGANSSIQNYAGSTPYGVSRGHSEVRKVLFYHGAYLEVDSESEDEDDDLQMYGFKDLHINGVVNTTA